MAEEQQPKYSVNSGALPEVDRASVIEETLGVIANLLEQLDDKGRRYALQALTDLVDDPGNPQSAVGMFEAAVANHSRGPEPPSSPTRPTKKDTPSKVAARKPAAPKLSVKPGGGQQVLYESPLPNLYKAHDLRTAPKRELEWYEELKKVPKAETTPKPKVK